MCFVTLLSIACVLTGISWELRLNVGKATISTVTNVA